MRPFARRRLVVIPAFLLCALAISPARAAGGAHAVDDAAVETPGDCHLESWITDFDDRTRLLNFGPACTLRSVPTVEFGATIQQLRAEGRTHWLIGPTLKWTIRAAEDKGPAMALAAAIVTDSRFGTIDTASVIMPISQNLSDHMAVNINIGWGYVRSEGQAAIYGAQIDYMLGNQLFFMTEIHGSIGDRPGVQAGLRWTVDKGRIDIDMLAAQTPGHAAPKALTLGITIRR